MTDQDLIKEVYKIEKKGLYKDYTVVADELIKFIKRREQAVARDIICMMEDRPAGGGWIKVLSPSGVEEVKKRYGI